MASGSHQKATNCPGPALDGEGELRRFLMVERGAGEIETRLIRGMREGSLSDAEFVDTIERKVLPPWTECRKRIESVITQSNANREGLAKVIKYAKCREDGRWLLVQGARERNPEKVRQADEKREAAQQMAREFSGQ